MRLDRIVFVSILGTALIAGAGCSSLHFHVPFTGGGSADGAAAPSQSEVNAATLKAKLAEAHADLVSLQANTELAPLVPKEISDAELSLKSADSGQYDSVTGAHQVYVADHKVQLARARAESRQLAAKLDALRAERAQLTGAAPTP